MIGNKSSMNVMTASTSLGIVTVQQLWLFQGELHFDSGLTIGMGASTCLPVYLSVYPSICLAVYLILLSVYLSTYVLASQRAIDL